MSGPDLTTYKDPDSPEYICLECPLPECNEGITCPYWVARGKTNNTKQGSRWASLIEEVRALKPGEFLIKEFELRDLRSAQSSVAWHAVQGRLVGNVITWRTKTEGQMQLNILRKGE